MWNIIGIYILTLHKRKDRKMDKKKYDVSIADVEMSIISDEREEFVMKLVEKLDSEVRDILLHSKRSTKVDAALLLALDYSCGKAKAEKRVRNLEAQIALYDANLRRMREDNIKLRSALLGSKDALSAQKSAEAEESFGAELGDMGSAGSDGEVDGASVSSDGAASAVAEKQENREKPENPEKLSDEKNGAAVYEGASQLTISADSDGSPVADGGSAATADAAKSDREDKLRQFDRIADLLRKKDN